MVRQLRYSEKDGKSLDLVLFLNGVPIFTAEIKNPLNGQDVESAIRQYKTDRDPREPLLAHGRCLAHFAVDPDLVYVTTQLAGARTSFVELHPHAIGEKLRIMVEHFAAKAQAEIGGKAKAMIVTRSRRHAVR